MRKLVVLLSIMALLAGCGPRFRLPPSAPDQNRPPTPSPATEAALVTIYLVQGEQLLPVTVRREAPVGELVEEALEALLEWNYPEWAVSPLSPTTEIRSVRVEGQTAIVDFGAQTLSGFVGGTLGETLLLKSLVLTLTGVPGIEKLQILLEGQPGEAVFGHIATAKPLYPSSVVNLEPESTIDENMVTLWFIDRHGMFSVPVSRSLPEGADWKSALQEFIKGPAHGSPLLSPLPPGTTLLNASLAEGTGTVDLSAEFVQNYGGGTALERLVIQSLVLTLTEFEQIERVQLLVEGEKGEAFLGHVTTAQPFTREQPNMFF